MDGVFGFGVGVFVDVHVLTCFFVVVDVEHWLVVVVERLLDALVWVEGYWVGDLLFCYC